MKRVSYFVAMLFAVALVAVPEADGAQKLNEAQRARLKRLIDTDGDGVISIPERGAARIFKGANRQQRAMGKNERVVRRIK